MKNLTYIIERYRLSTGLGTTEFDQQFLQFAINGMQKLNDFGLLKQCVKSVQLDIVNHRANLPADFNSLVRLGVCRQGVLIAFDRNDDLCLSNENACPCDAVQIDTCMNDCVNGNYDGLGFWTFPIYGQPYSYSYTAGSYAIGPGFAHGGYTIDVAKQQIVFDKCVRPEWVVLEYVGDFLNDMGNAIVPNQFTECLTTWVDYERKYFSPDLQMQRAATGAKARWFQIVRDLNSKQQSMTAHDWTRLFREFCYMQVKA